MLLQLQRATASALAAALLALCAHQPPALASDCGATGGCSRVDFGSCGNACCALDFRVKVPADAMAAKLERALRSGGPDGQYSLPPLEGGRTGFNDLRPLGVPYEFIGQAVHATKKMNFKDTINMAIVTEGSTTRVRAFSTSQIGGALGDQGQNYRNVNALLGAVTDAPGEVVYGCGGPGSAVMK